MASVNGFGQWLRSMASVNGFGHLAGALPRAAILRQIGNNGC
jgi:hypothetical protein